MKAQGLSMKFIVLLVLAILVLVLVALMLYRSQSSSNAMNRENAINTCRDFCVQAENMVMNVQGKQGVFDTPPGSSAPKYCNIVLNIDGQQEHCYQVYTCRLTDGDGDSEVLNAATCSSWGESP